MNDGIIDTYIVLNNKLSLYRKYLYLIWNTIKYFSKR